MELSRVEAFEYWCKRVTAHQFCCCAESLGSLQAILDRKSPLRSTERLHFPSQPCVLARCKLLYESVRLFSKVDEKHYRASPVYINWFHPAHPGCGWMGDEKDWMGDEKDQPLEDPDETRWLLQTTASDLDYEPRLLKKKFDTRVHPALWIDEKETGPRSAAVCRSRVLSVINMPVASYDDIIAALAHLSTAIMPSVVIMPLGRIIQLTEQTDSFSKFDSVVQGLANLFTTWIPTKSLQLFIRPEINIEKAIKWRNAITVLLPEQMRPVMEADVRQAAGEASSGLL